MDQQDSMRFEALMRQAEFRRQFRNSRVDVEWRVTLAAWALMVGIATTVTSYPPWFIFYGVPVVVVLHLIWLRDNFERNQQDARLMWSDYDAARATIGVEVQQAPQVQPLLQGVPTIAVTVILGVLVITLRFLHA